MMVPLVSTRYKIIIGVALLVMVASIPSIYFYSQYQKVQMRASNPTEAAKQDVRDTIAAVAKLMILPVEEEPTIATITDITRLKDQPFFVNAQNGDKVLIYTKSKKAILYRPDTAKIVDIAPVNIGTSAAAVATPSTAIATPSATVPTEFPTPTKN